MRHEPCAYPKCTRRILPGQVVVWVPPTTETDLPGRPIVINIASGYAHAEHVLPKFARPLRVTYTDEMGTEDAFRRRLWYWDEQRRPTVPEMARREMGPDADDTRTG